MAVVNLDQIDISEATPLAVEAAEAAGMKVPRAFEAFKPGMSKLRMVHIIEADMATSIANELDLMAIMLDGAYEDLQDLGLEEHFLESQGPILRQAACLYRTIMTTMRVEEATTIAAPGIDHVESAHAHILATAWMVAPEGLSACLSKAQRLLVSLAMDDALLFRDGKSPRAR